MGIKIAREEYHSILKGIDLKNIYLKSLKTDIKHDLITEAMSVNIKQKAGYLNIKDGFKAEYKCNIIVKNNKKVQVLKIECVFEAIFSSTKKITNEFFEIYQGLSLPLNLWPFARELVNSITSRMYIPPLTLPLFKR